MNQVHAHDARVASQSVGTDASGYPSYEALIERTIRLLEQYVYGDEPVEMVAFAELLEDWRAARSVQNRR